MQKKLTKSKIQFLHDKSHERIRIEEEFYTVKAVHDRSIAVNILKGENTKLLH